LRGKIEEQRQKRKKYRGWEIEGGGVEGDG